MNRRNLRPSIDAMLAVCLLALAACSDPEQTTDATSSPAEDTAAITEPAAVETAEEAAPAGELEALGGVAETEGLDEEIVEAEEEIVLKDSTEPAAEATAQTAWKYSEGKHYRRMTTSQGTSSAPDKIEVAEVFWYGCPHCFSFDPILSEWEEDLPADVSFVRIPVIWNPTNQVHARLMYTAEALGVMDEAHTAIFKSIHQSGNMLTSEADMVKMFATLGVDEDAFLEAYKSFGVSSAVKRAENLTRRYGIKSVPVLVINGKYATDAPEVKSFGDMLDVTNELVERERSEP